MKKVQEEYCASCEKLLLVESEKLGPVCFGCFKQTRRRDPLMKAAIRSSIVVIVPMVCPHDDRKHGRCKFKEPKQFSVIVLDKNLEPKQITAPWTERGAEREAKRLRRRLSRKEPL